MEKVMARLSYGVLECYLSTEKASIISYYTKAFPSDYPKHATWNFYDYLFIFLNADKSAKLDDVNLTGADWLDKYYSDRRRLLFFLEDCCLLSNEYVCSNYDPLAQGKCSWYDSNEKFHNFTDLEETSVPETLRE